MIDALPLLLGPEGYQISRSVRLRSSASAYFNRTPASATNRKTWTWSAWVKRGLLSSTDQYNLFTCWSANTDTAFLQLAIYQDKIFVGGWLTNFLISTPVYRDPSAWYHVVITLDTTQATASNRLRVYVNGVEVTAWATDSRSSITQNSDMGINQAAEHNIGRRVPAAYYFDGYLTEINFIDGQALTPASFGETNPVTGVWQPKKYAGTYGTNGFYLNFADNSAATAAAIGKDSSGNGNNWTPNNISVTAGVTYDSMLDVPTAWADGGNGRGNYAVISPLDFSGTAGTLSEGNLSLSNSASGARRATMGMTNEKIYWEIIQSSTVNASNPISYGAFGLTGAVSQSSTAQSVLAYTDNGSNKAFWRTTTAGIVQTVTPSSFTMSPGDVLQIAYDGATGKFWFGKNGTTWYDGSGGTTGDPSTGANPVFTLPDLTNPMGPGFSHAGVAYTARLNCGQRPFSYTPPSGFKALNTQNLPTPTILKGNQYFDALTWTGDGTGARSITGSQFQPDLVWTKNRSVSSSHQVNDSVRGPNLRINTDATNGEGANAVNGYLTSFDANGFSTAVGSTNIQNYNTNGSTYIGWLWKEGATQGFDIVTYTGDGTSPRNISHNLGVTPAMVIVKSRNAVASWMVKHKNLSTNNNLFLETNGAQSSPSNGYIQDLNNSSTFGVVNGGGGVANINGSGTTYVAYLFAEVAGFSKFGSYTGNASADGPFVFCGFRPRFIIFKNTAAGNNWLMFDTARNTSNLTQNKVAANAANPENDVAISSVSENNLDILSNGFKLRTINAQNNGSGATIIFAAFAENPFKNALAR